jgi:hypothetical protein
MMITGLGMAWDMKWDSDSESDWDLDWNDDWKDFESDWEIDKEFEEDFKFDSIEFDEKKEKETEKDSDTEKNNETEEKDSKESKKDGKDKKDEEVVYWQVDFGEGEVPIPPTYAPDDLMAALGNSSAVSENPSLLRQRTNGQLGDVEIEDNSFEIDEENPTEATVRFTVEEDAENRTLHLASFELPGPYDHDEVDQQVLYDSEVRTFEGGETGEMTVELPGSEVEP